MHSYCSSEIHTSPLLLSILPGSVPSLSCTYPSQSSLNPAKVLPASFTFTVCTAWIRPRGPASSPRHPEVSPGWPLGLSFLSLSKLCSPVPAHGQLPQACQHDWVGPSIPPSFLSLLLSPPFISLFLCVQNCYRYLHLRGFKASICIY